MAFLYTLPIWLFGLIIVGSFTLLAVAGLKLFPHLTAGRLRLTEETNNDIIFFASAISVFYSLTVGLIAVGVWTTYTQVQDIVSGEAAAIGALYRDVSSYPEPPRTQLQGSLRTYTEYVITQAWPAQTRGELLDDGTRLLSAFQDELYQYEPTTPGREILHAETLRQYNQLITMRRLRIDAVGGGLPSVMWWIVLLGAAMTIGVTYLLKIEWGVHLFLSGLLGMFIGLVVFVIASLERPLSGPLTIGPDAYQLVLEHLINLQ